MSRKLDLASLANHLATTQDQKRRIVAIVGAPGAGKSTFAEALQATLSERVNCEVLPMDGFHLPRSALDAMPDPERAHARRGNSTSTKPATEVWVERNV